MIITVTLNPAVDRTIAVKELLPGTVMRTTGVTICAGGKGINVSRAVRAAGGDTCAVFFKGGIEGALIEDLMQKDGIAVRTVPTAAASRISTQIAEDSGRFSNLNDVGGPITAAELEALIDMLDQLVGADDVLVLAGSIPAGVPADIYAQLTLRFKGRCRAIAVDADGDALTAATEICPSFIKPNEHELAGFAGRSFSDFDDMIRFARSIAGKVADHILLTLGGDGACYISKELCLRSESIPVKAISTVGAGDTFLAGFLTRFEQGCAPAECLAFASALSSAKVTMPGTTMPSPALYHELVSQAKVYTL